MTSAATLAGTAALVSGKRLGPQLGKTITAEASHLALLEHVRKTYNERMQSAMASDGETERHQNEDLRSVE